MFIEIVEEVQALRNSLVFKLWKIITNKQTLQKYINEKKNKSTRYQKTS